MSTGTSRRIAAATPALLLGLGVVATMSSPPAAALSCAGPEAVLDDAPQAFTGRVVAVDGERITVDVDQVWWGGPVADRVEMRVDLLGWSAWADGTSSRWVEWLFAPTAGDGQLEVNPCTAWETGGEWLAETLAEHRPETTTEPVASSPRDAEVEERREGQGESFATDGPRGTAALVGGAAAAGLLLAGLGIVLARRPDGRRGGTGSAA